MKDGGRADFVIPWPDQCVTERAKISILFSFIVSVVASSCALQSPNEPKVQTLQQAILVLDFA